MTNTYLKPLLLIASLCATAFVAGCEAPQTEADIDQIELETQTVEVPAAEDNATPAVAEAPEVPANTVPVESVPQEPRSSEQSVQPDSETMFY